MKNLTKEDAQELSRLCNRLNEIILEMQARKDLIDLGASIGEKRGMELAIETINTLTKKITDLENENLRLHELISDNHIASLVSELRGKMEDRE